MKKLLSFTIYLCIGLLLSLTLKSQNNALVLNGAVTILNGGTAATPIYVVVNQKNPSGIVRNSGHIHSENQYNYVKWETGIISGSYVIPFGVGGNLADYIPFTFNKTTTNSTGIQMSTWFTNVPNFPKPAATNVGSVTNMLNFADSVQYAIDRFWEIQAANNTIGDLTFSYRGVENTTINPTGNVRTQHWNGTSWDAPVTPGIPGVTGGIGSAGPFVGQNTFSPWVLSVIPVCPEDTISYTENPFCVNDTNTYSVTHTNATLTGTYSATPVGLSLNTTTGDIVPSLSMSGVYIITFTVAATSTCPQYQTSTTVAINTPDDASFTYNPTTFCITGTNPIPTINGTTGGIFTISAAGVINATTGEIDLMNSGAGTYMVYNNIAASGGCAAVVDSFQITINPSYFNVQTAQVCQGDSVLLGGVFQSTSGVYNDTLVTQSGCDSIISTTLTVNPVALTQPSISICQGDSIMLGGVFQTTAGIYYDSLMTSFGCDSIVETILTITPQNTIIIDTVVPLCFGDNIALTATGSGNGTIAWYADAVGTIVIGTGSLLVIPSTSIGVITFYASEVGECDSSIDSVQVLVEGVQAVINATPTTGLTPLNVFFGNGSTTGSGIFYVWDFGNGNTDTIFEPSQVYDQTGTYPVTLIVTDGICSDTVTTVITAIGESVIIIPNVFTPNGDGSNDMFMVGGENLEEVEGVIYNRWGQKLYEWNSVAGGWDGRTFQGEVVPDGTYFFIINAKGTDGKEYFEKGTVTLLR